MIDAWDIYWVMQLDSIGTALGAISLLGLIFCAALVVLGAMNKTLSNDFPELSESKQERASGEAQHKIALRVAPYVAALFLVNAFIPSTRTAAAMIVVPAIANNDAIKQEAGDLYDLAKDALRQAVSPNKPAPKE